MNLEELLSKLPTELVATGLEDDRTHVDRHDNLYDSVIHYEYDHKLICDILSLTTTGLGYPNLTYEKDGDSDARLYFKKDELDFTGIYVSIKATDEHVKYYEELEERFFA
ncbi:MAG: hypothetical protein FWC68_03785 [Oscillospiraceae bacterium]|nr:hypothetical protein [Oscillospiraceae bacterium]